MSRGYELKGRAKKSLRLMERMLDDEPVMLVSADGRHWTNLRARDFLKERGIASQDLFELLNAGTSWSGRIYYGGIALNSLRLPGGDFFVHLTEEEDQAGRLTAKEKEVLGFLVRGCSNKEIAGLLEVSPGTINTHLDNIYRKFGCSSRLEACFIAMRDGFPVPALKKKNIKSFGKKPGLPL